MGERCRAPRGHERSRVSYQKEVIFTGFMRAACRRAPVRSGKMHWYVKRQSHKTTQHVEVAVDPKLSCEVEVHTGLSLCPFSYNMDDEKNKQQVPLSFGVVICSAQNDRFLLLLEHSSERLTVLAYFTEWYLLWKTAIWKNYIDVLINRTTGV